MDQVPARVSADRRRSGVLFVCDAGGHLMEAIEIARHHYGDREPCFHTADTPMSRSLLADREVSFSTRRVVPARADLALREVWTATRHLRRLRRDRGVSTVVSPGSAYALPWLLAARLLRLEAVFVESAARLTSSSRVGRLVSKVPGVHLATQAPFRLDGWEQWPSVVTTALQDHHPAGRPGRDGPVKIVVTVGTYDFAFDRLVRRVDEVCPPDWEITWQLGPAALPSRGDVAAARPYEELQRAMAEADLVIGHAGVGTVLSAVSAGARLVLAPRLQRFAEHVDDHQTELASLIGHAEGIVALADVADLTLELLLEQVRAARA